MARRGQEQDEVRLVAACKSPALCRRVQAEPYEGMGINNSGPRSLKLCGPLLLTPIRGKEGSRHDVGKNVASCHFWQGERGRR